MNYIKHLTGFFNHIAIENEINPTHISLYVTIFQSWNLNRFQNPVIISRDEIMKASKINSKATYHKCIRDLERLGYLEYTPSYNPYVGTAITVVDLTQGKKQRSSKNPSATSSINERAIPNNERTSLKNEQVYIYNKTYTNNENIDIENNENLTSSNFDKVKAKKKKEKKGSGQKKEKALTLDLKATIQESRKVEIPSLELVKEYFKFQENTEFEAERFFNYYSSNGWLIGGKAKMEDWKAAARNWMLNTGKFSMNTPKKGTAKENDRAHNLHAKIDKDYSEPL